MNLCACVCACNNGNESSEYRNAATWRLTCHCSKLFLDCMPQMHATHNLTNVQLPQHTRQPPCYAITLHSCHANARQHSNSQLRPECLLLGHKQRCVARMLELMLTLQHCVVSLLWLPRMHASVSKVTKAP